MRSMRLDNTPSEEDMEQAAKDFADWTILSGAIKEDAVEVILDNHLGTTEVCPVCISKHIIGVLGSCGKG